MATPGKTEYHPCSVCSVAAVAVCKDCKSTPDKQGNLTSVYYCSADCQEEDWNAHKPLCQASQDRRTFFRAANLAQSLYLVFARKTWIWPIDKVKRVERAKSIGDLWEVYDGEASEEHYFAPFPEALLPNVEDQKSILCFGNCRTAVALLSCFLKDLLKIYYKDIYAEMYEVTLFVKNTNLSIVRFPIWASIPQSTNVHVVFRVTLKNEESYALDVTAPQYGWHDTNPMPWDTFVERRIGGIQEIQNFGSIAEFLRVGAQVAAPVLRNHREHMQGMRCCVRTFLVGWLSRNMSWNDLSMCSEDDFEIQQRLLLDHVKVEVSQLRTPIDEEIEES